MKVERAERLKALPPYLFQEIDRLKAELMAQGADVINLGVGDPDLPTPFHIIQSMQDAAEDPANHQYPSYSGMNDFKVAIAKWYQRRFNVELEPLKEVVTLIGSKEGIAHIPLAFINPGDVALVPTPAYPVYHAGVLFAGGKSHFMPLTAENGFLPDLKAIPEDVAKAAKMMFINYPNNPTAAVADIGFFTEVVEFAKKYNIIVCHDAAYTEVTYDGYKPVSFLEAPGAKDVGIEFHSLSKTYNMTGWRIGSAAGNADIVAGLGAVKSNIDSGAFNAVQIAGITALEYDQQCVADNNATYQKRRDLLVAALREAGLQVEPPKACLYVWCPVPGKFTSAEFSSYLLKEAAIVATPGSGFGDPGEGYIRFSLTVEDDRLEEAVERIRKLSL